MSNMMPSTSFDISEYRNTAVPNAVAGIHNPCKTILAEHMPVGIKNINLVGKHLDPTNDADMFYTGGSTGSITYASKLLTVTTGISEVGYQYVTIGEPVPVTAKFAEFVISVPNWGSNVPTGSKYLYLGLSSDVTTTTPDEILMFFRGRDYFGYKYLTHAIVLPSSTITNGSVLAIRVFASEGAVACDTLQFIIDGEIYFETAYTLAHPLRAFVGLYTQTAYVEYITMDIDNIRLKVL